MVQTIVSGSEIFGALHKKSILRSCRVSGFVGLDQTSDLGFSGLGHFLGVDEVPGPPVALHEPPSSGHVDGVPRVPETVVLEPDPRLVSGGFAVALDHDAVKTGKAGKR